MRVANKRRKLRKAMAAYEASRVAGDPRRADGSVRDVLRLDPSHPKLLTRAPRPHRLVSLYFRRELIYGFLA